MPTVLTVRAILDQLLVLVKMDRKMVDRRGKGGNALAIGMEYEMMGVL